MLVDQRPPAVMRRGKPPGLIIDPGPAPRRDPAPMPEAVGRPFEIVREPDGAVIARRSSRRRRNRARRNRSSSARRNRAQRDGSRRSRARGTTRQNRPAWRGSIVSRRVRSPPAQHAWPASMLRIAAAADHMRRPFEDRYAQSAVRRFRYRCRKSRDRAARRRPAENRSRPLFSPVGDPAQVKARSARAKARSAWTARPQFGNLESRAALDRPIVFAPMRISERARGSVRSDFAGKHRLIELRVSPSGAADLSDRRCPKHS